MWFAADYPFLDIFWTMIIFFCWVIWIWMMISILMDVFSRHDVGGWSKALWVVFLIVLPFLGVLIYLIANGQEMGKRDVDLARASQAQFDQHIKSVAGSGTDGAASEIAKAKSLLDSGAITREEYEALKSKALS